MNNQFDVIVIGGGPAGSAAAGWLARQQISTALIDKGEACGYLGSFAAIDFLPRQLDIPGKALIKALHDQTQRMGATLIQATVSKIISTTPPLTVHTDSETYTATRALLLATGAAQRTGAIEGEGAFLGNGVWHDTEWGGATARGKTVAVVGKSLHAAEEALKLSRLAEKLLFIIPSSKLDVPTELFKQLEGRPNIELCFSTSIKRINGNDQLSSLTILSAGQEKEIPVQALFTFMHDFHTSNELVQGIVEMAEKGEILVDEAFATSVPGIFACGDMLCARPQHPTVAMAQGIIAAMKILKSLQENPSS